ncbi:MAG TPA: hypothetical protein VG412_02645 [Acidimicrobiales bacterium]|jgi:hypothetical protein|nr:hypothetical protein [Acidimicrobiales bacterium]
MPDHPTHRVERTDEGLHVPDTDPLWNESYYLDFVADDGSVGGYARIGLYPNLGVTWWTTMVVGPDRPMVASVDYHLPTLTGSDVILEADGHSIACASEDPLRTMRLRATAPASSHDDPSASYRDDPGRATALAMDLEWSTDGTPYHYDVTTRYEIPCRVEGEVSVGDERIVVRGEGQRDHSWGVRDWWAFGWCWASVRLDDGTRVHWADIRFPGFPVALGYVQPPDGSVRTIETLSVSEDDGTEGMPTRGTAVVEPGHLELDIEPLAFAPLRLTADDGRISRFPRAMARFTAGDGRAGTGWIEWNQPETEPARR